MENHYDRHTYTDIGTLLLNTYEQTFLEYEREHPQDLNIIACPTCARSPPRRERRAGARGGPSRSRDDPPPFAREGVARGEPPNALGWVECDACRVLTHVDCARAGAADLTPGGNVAWFVCDACDETSNGNARRTPPSNKPPSNVAGTTDAGTRSVGAGVEKRRKRSRDDVRSRRPAPRSIGDDVRAASAARGGGGGGGGGGRTTNLRPETRRGGDAFRRGRCRATTNGGEAGGCGRGFGDGRIRGRRGARRRGGRRRRRDGPRARLAPLERRRRTPRRAGRKSASRVRPAGPEREPDAEALGGGRAEIGQSVFAGRVRDTPRRRRVRVESPWTRGVTRLEKEGRERKREREGGGGGVGGRGFEPATVPTPRKRSADRAERSPRRAPVAREELGTRDRTPLARRDAARRADAARRRR